MDPDRRRPGGPNPDDDPYGATNGNDVLVGTAVFERDARAGGHGHDLGSRQQ